MNSFSLLKYPSPPHPQWGKAVEIAESGLTLSCVTLSCALVDCPGSAAVLTTTPPAEFVFTNNDDMMPPHNFPMQLAWNSLSAPLIPAHTVTSDAC